MPNKSTTVIDIVRSREKDSVIFRVKGKVRNLEHTAPANTTFWHLRSHNTSQIPLSPPRLYLAFTEPLKATFEKKTRFFSVQLIGTKLNKKTTVQQL